VQAGDIAAKVIKAVAGNTARRVQIDAVKALHDLRVVGDLEIGHSRLAEALHLNIAAVVRADGNARIDHLRDDHHALGEFRLVLRLELFQLGQTCGLARDLGLDVLGLLQLGGVLLRLSHQHADLLGKGVAVGAKLVRLGLRRAQLLIKLHHLVHEGELLVLELLADVLAHELRVLTDKTNVQHDIFSSILFLFPGLVHVPERFH